MKHAHLPLASVGGLALALLAALSDPHLLGAAPNERTDKTCLSYLPLALQNW
jgi:hypothetical protein